MKNLTIEQEISKTIDFIKEQFKKSNFSKAVIGVSGGIDSATSLFLTVKALGKENVYAVLLPYGQLNLSGADNSMLLVESLGLSSLNVLNINIKPMCDMIFSTDPQMTNLRRGNIMARIRMIFLYDQARKNNALVVGTENKSEHYLGYFTRFGDEASDIEPLRNYYKTEIYKIAKVLNVPAEVINTPPTAGLWDGQTDENEMGFSYKDADNYLYQLIEEGKDSKQIVIDGVSAETIEKIRSRVDMFKFKHNLPIINI